MWTAFSTVWTFALTGFICISYKTNCGFSLKVYKLLMKMDSVIFDVLNIHFKHFTVQVFIRFIRALQFAVLHLHHSVVSDGDYEGLCIREGAGCRRCLTSSPGNGNPTI